VYSRGGLAYPDLGRLVGHVETVAAKVLYNVCVVALLEDLDLVQHLVQVLARLERDDLDGRDLSCGLDKRLHNTTDLSEFVTIRVNPTLYT